MVYSSFELVNRTVELVNYIILDLSQFSLVVQSDPIHSPDSLPKLGVLILQLPYTFK